MDSSPPSKSSFFISPEEFNLFHSIDRQLYTLLVTGLARNPLESVQMIALWLWLERSGFSSVVKKILSLPHFLINELADEASTCLKCISGPEQGPAQDQLILHEIPITESLTNNEISLAFFLENRNSIIRGIAKVETEVCVRALSDILKQALTHHGLGPTKQALIAYNGPHLTGFGPVKTKTGPPAPPGPEERTMFVTFSKGYPVEEWEVREFFTIVFGENCIESFFMQEVKPNEQALFARIVFSRPSIIEMVLNGETKAKFNINGKHIWMRKFVPKRSNLVPAAAATTTTMVCYYNMQGIM